MRSPANRWGCGSWGVQEVDICSIVAPITKYAVTVLEPIDIRYHLEKAVYLAMNGRPGPVWIDVPLDVQASPIDETTLRSFDPTEYAHADFIHGTSNIAEEVKRTIEAFNACERPLLFAGNGIRLARAEKEFEELRQYLGVPTVATWCAADLVPSDDSTYVGRPGSVAARGANFALQNCDLLLAIGVRLDFAITGYAPQNLAREAHKIAVDIDPAELGKLHPYLQQPVCADARVFLTELLKHKDQLKPRNIEAWLTRCADWKTRYPVVTDEHRRPEGLVSIFNLAEVLGEEVSPNDRLVVGNSGSGIEIYLLACPTLHSQRLYHTAGLGSMGYAIPMAIAVAIANPGREVIAVDGDGGFMFNIQELETIHRLNLPIKFFVLNNDGYSSIRASQKAYFGAPSIGADRTTGLTIPNLSKVGASYGLGTYVIEDQTGPAGRGSQGAGHARARSVRRQRASRRGARAPPAVLPEARWQLCLQASRRSLPLPAARRVPRQHDREARAGVAAGNPLLPKATALTATGEALSPMPHTYGIMQGRLGPPEDGRFQSFPRQHWREEFARARAAGLDYIEWIHDHYDRGANPIFTADGLAELDALKRKHGIATPALCGDWFMDFPLIRCSPEECAEREQHLHQLIPIAASIGATKIVLPFVDQSKIGTEAEKQQVLGILERALPVAQEHDVELHLEADFNPADFAAFLTRIPHPGLKVNWDSGNSSGLGLCGHGRVCRLRRPHRLRAYQGSLS